MSLTIYRRHRDGCSHGDDRISKRCNCQLWFTGTLLGKPYRKSARTRNWKAAEQIKNRLERGDEKPRASLADACALFLSDCQARNYRPPTLNKAIFLAKTLQDFLGNVAAGDIEAPHLVNFRATWKDAAITQKKKVERLRSMFTWFHDHDIIAKNVARGLKCPLQHDTAVEPFSPEEQDKIIGACYRFAGIKIVPKQAPLHPNTGTFARFLLMTGLRITDAAMLSKDRLRGGSVFLYATKNKRPVMLPLPPDLVHELDAISSHQLFQSPQRSTRGETVSDYWRDQLNKVFKHLNIEGHPHRFRHTLAVNMLNAGSSTEDVALVLGDSPITVAKHYSSFVQTRQERINREIQKTWPKAKLTLVENKSGA
jgi:integrase